MKIKKSGRLGNLSDFLFRFMLLYPEHFSRDIRVHFRVL